MDRATVIVALPSVDEKVYRISSEQIPHLTLAYLGTPPDDQLEGIVQFVQHAASQLSPFGMSVDYRGTLGADEADVLFFENTPDSRISSFRGHLLSNDSIQTAYQSVDQFPQWTPHLTLGYPEAPAHKDTDEYPGIRYVNFDRIAVWMGDFEGPEFRLKYEDHAMEVSMSSTQEIGAAAAVDVLSHHGVKGMKWGVRNDKGHEGEKVKTKNLDKLDKKWEDDMGRHAYMKLYNAAADKMNNGGIDAINNSEKYKDVDLTKPENSKLLDEYYNDHEVAFQKAMVEAGPSLGMNPSGTKQFVIKKVTDPDTGEEYDDVFLEPVGVDVKHAAGDTTPGFRLKRNATGHITKYVAEEFELQHHGVKGMHWGVRKKESGAGGDGAAAAPKERGKVKRALTKANTALDAGATVIKEGEKKLIFLPQENRNKAASATQAQVLGAAAAINRSPQFKGKDLKRDPELKAEYFKQVSEAAKKIYADELGIARTEAWADFLGVKVDTAGMRISAASNRMQHSNDGEETLLVLQWDLDELGQISDVTVPPAYLKQSGDLGLELRHYGVKGMKWGVTTVDKAATPTLTREKQTKIMNTKDVVVTQKKAGTYVQTKGGQRHKASDDAVKAHAGRQKAKKSTTDALTNEELKATIERMRLEQEFKKLDSKVKRQGSGFIRQLLSSPAARQTAADLTKKVTEADK